MSGSRFVSAEHHQFGQPVDAYSSQHLWETATRFLTNALDALDNRNEEQAALWAACSLEMLGKSALSRISPVLIAESKAEHALAAVGFGGTGVRSRPAHEIYKMCAMAFPGFDLKVAVDIADARNAEIHSGERPFHSIRSGWWESFWSLAVLLAIAQDRELSDLVGVGPRVTYVSDQLALNKDFVLQQAKALVDRAIRRLALVRSPKGDAEIEAQMEAQTEPYWFRYDFQSNRSVPCPACHDEALVYGVAVGQTVSPSVDGQAYREIEYKFRSQAFFCNTCKLLLEGPAYLEAVGLPAEFYLIVVD